MVSQKNSKDINQTYATSYATFHFLFFHNDFIRNFRLGTQQGFQNIVKAQCHCVGTAAMNQAAGSVHENVVGYDESHLNEHLEHEIDMGVSLDFVQL